MWRFAAAKAIGTSHVRANLPCQDQFGCAALPGGILVAAIADGAGSAVMAERGAEIAVQTIVAHLRHGVEENRADFLSMLREGALAARAAVVSEAVKQGSEPRGYASTLLALVLTPEGGGALQIGDGVIVVNDGAGWSWVFWPQRGEYANTTHFLTDEDALERVEAEVFSGEIIDVALMSDGLEPLALHYASRTVHDPFFEGMFRPFLKSQGSAEIVQLSTALEQFLVSDRVMFKTNDDVSLILATRRHHHPCE